MNTPPYSNPQRYARSETFDLKCSVHSSAAGDGRFVYDAVLKVENGVKFLCELWPERPSEALMADRCAQHGTFSPRPYRAGQMTDDSTPDCVLALYYHYCRSSAIDATALLVRTYPGWETPDKWTDAAWRTVLESADWHGTAVPSRWTGDGVIGLLLSLATQGHRELAETLTREILLRRPTPETGEPS
jgi:hypothetical protein